jgi:hypothetical protein
MRKHLITAGAVLLMAAPAFAQSVTTETKSKEVTIEASPSMPLATPPAAVIPMPERAMPGISEDRSSTTITNSGDSGISRTDRSSQKYIGTDGMVHEDMTIRREEQR